MRRHDHFGRFSCLNGLSVGCQINRIRLFARRIDDSKSQVRVRCRISMSRKMLESTYHALAGHTLQGTTA